MSTNGRLPVDSGGGIPPHPPDSGAEKVAIDGLLFLSQKSKSRDRGKDSDEACDFKRHKSLDFDKAGFTPLPADDGHSMDTCEVPPDVNSQHTNNTTTQAQHPNNLKTQSHHQQQQSHTQLHSHTEKQQNPNLHNINPNDKSPYTRLRYSDKQKGPCKVMIQRDRASERAKDDLNPMTYGKAFTLLYKEAVLNVDSQGFGKLCVTVRSNKDANRILNDSQTLKNKGLFAFVPASFVTCQGVVKNVPIELSEKEILDNLEILGYLRDTTSAVNVRRLNRKVTDKDTGAKSITPSTSIQITFEGTALPDKVAIFKSASAVQIYTPQVKMCLKCLRYGHISTNCRSSARCKQCGGSNTHSEQEPCPNVDSAPKCCNCNGNHLPTSQSCPELVFQKQFRAYATKHGVSFAEAKEVIRPKKQSRSGPASGQSTSFINFSDHPDLNEVPAPSFLDHTYPIPTRSYSEAISSRPKPLSKAKANKTPLPLQTSQLNRSTPNFSSFHNNGRTRSSLPNGFALHPPSSLFTDRPSTDAVSIIGNLIEALTGLSSILTSDISSNVEERDNFLNRISNSIKSLSNSLLASQNRTGSAGQTGSANLNKK